MKKVSNHCLDGHNCGKGCLEKDFVCPNGENRLKSPLGVQKQPTLKFKFVVKTVPNHRLDSHNHRWGIEIS